MLSSWCSAVSLYQEVGEVPLSILFVLFIKLTCSLLIFSTCHALQQPLIACCFGLATGKNTHMLQKVDAAQKKKGVAINTQNAW